MLTHIREILSMFTLISGRDRGTVDCEDERTKRWKGGKRDEDSRQVLRDVMQVKERGRQSDNG